MRRAFSGSGSCWVVASTALGLVVAVAGCGAEHPGPDVPAATAAGEGTAPGGSTLAPRDPSSPSSPEPAASGRGGDPSVEGRPGENATLVGTEPGAGSNGSAGAEPGEAVPGSTAPDSAIEGDLPLVYGEEDTGADCLQPLLPGFDALPAIPFLPDPFLMSSGERMASRAEWRCRRAEIQSTLARYDVGEKPKKPTTVQASLDGNTIRIDVSEGGTSFTMTANLARPANAASGPIPAIIGINAPTGSLPAGIFSSRGIATITYDANQIAPTSFSNNPRSAGNFFAMYPGATAGYMVRWAWGVSRIIDALEQLPEANIDLSHLAVSGCSFQGKIALYAGALDERIALTIPHESGGGGTISWRYSDLLERRDNTEVENLLHAQGAPWYAEALQQFNNAPDRLPFDHHELMALVAPRALLAIESTAIARMGAEAARVDALAAREVWAALGVPDRMGAAEENVNHCVWHDGFTPDLEAYVDRFLLGKVDVNTDILRSRFTIDTETWIPWSTPALE